MIHSICEERPADAGRQHVALPKAESVLYYIIMFKEPSGMKISCPQNQQRCLKETWSDKVVNCRVHVVELNPELPWKIFEFEVSWDEQVS